MPYNIHDHLISNTSVHLQNPRKQQTQIEDCLSSIPSALLDSESTYSNKRRGRRRSILTSSKKAKTLHVRELFFKIKPSPPKKEMQINATINKYHSSKNYPSSDINGTFRKTRIPRYFHKPPNGKRKPTTNI